MKMNDSRYIAIKLILILVLVGLFFFPEVFVTNIPTSSTDTVIICRGMSLILAIYIASTLVDNLYKK